MRTYRRIEDRRKTTNASSPGKIIVLILFTFMIISAGSVIHADGPPHVSMLTNGDFENLFNETNIGEHWSARIASNDPDGTLVSFQNDPDPHAGANAQQIVCSEYGSGAINFINHTPVPIRQANTYKITLWMKGNVEGPVFVGLQNLSEKPYTIHMEESFVVTADWQRYEFTHQDISCDHENCEARFKISFASTGTLSIDDVNVYDLDHPVIDGTVYIDSNPEVGSDKYDGKSPSRPWRSIKKLYDFDVLPGARILFKKGGKWQGPVIVPSQVDSNQDPVKYGSYGQGERPIINGAIPIEKWKPYNDGDPNTNIYVADDVPQKVKQLIVDGRRQVLARYPSQEKPDAITYHTVTKECEYTQPEDDDDANDDTEHLTCLIDADNLRQRDPDFWTGANVYIRTRPWLLEKFRIIKYLPGENKIVIDPEIKPEDKTIIKEGHGYYIENKLAVLDAPGEWFYSAEEDKLYYWPLPGVSIDDAMVEASVVDDGFKSDRGTAENIVIAGFDIRNFSNSGIRFTHPRNVQFSGNKIRNCGADGIEIATVRKPNSEDTKMVGEDIIMVDNEIEDIVRDGISVRFAKRCTIGNNKIRFCKGRSILYANIINGAIRHNHISDSGYNGLSLHGESLYNNLVKGNIINRSCLLLDDGAGIYCGGDNPGGGNGKTNRISSNIVTNSIGNTDGITDRHTKAQGIYLDERANHYALTGNVVVNTDNGIQIHNSHSHKVQGNTIYNARKTGILITHNGNDDKINSPVYGNEIDDGNIFHSLSDKQACVHLAAKFTDCQNCDIEGFAAFDSNYYAHPNMDHTFFRKYADALEFFTLPQWQDATDNDRHSVDFDGSQSDIFINVEQSPKIFDLKGISYVSLENEPVGATIEVDALSAIVLIRKEMNYRF